MRKYLHQHKAVIKRVLWDFLHFQLLFLLFDMVLHELAHAGAAVIAGVPLDAIGFGRNGFSPVVYVTQDIPTAASTLVSYAGGIVPAFFFTIVFIILWQREYHFRRSISEWTLGAALITRISLSLLAGFFEGAVPAAYLAARTVSLSRIAILMNAANVAAVIAAVCFYALLIMPPETKAEANPSTTK